MPDQQQQLLRSDIWMLTGSSPSEEPLDTAMIRRDY